MSNTKTSRTGSIISFILSGLFVVTATWMFLNRQLVLDQISVWSYEPSASIASIGERVGFTDRGKFVFYATQPSIYAPEAFNKACPRAEPASPILGCYTPEDRIYVYDLSNDQLNGMEEVTAAHEMLHAVWYRTDEKKKEFLSKELKRAYEKLNNNELDDRMDYYERTSPSELINELHSILGTEVNSLGEPLESYYAEFFDRESVLKLHQQYSAVYEGLQTQANELYSQLEILNVSIQSRTSAYEAAAIQLSADINSFNRRANSGAFYSQSQFNSERAALVSRTNSLEREREGINNDISRYTANYEQYQEIASQIEVLNDSLDSIKQIEQGPSV